VCAPTADLRRAGNHMVRRRQAVNNTTTPGLNSTQQIDLLFLCSYKVGFVEKEIDHF
jgi:hypothetical protein